MRRWFLSYHSPDQALAERLKAAIERKDDSASRVFFAPNAFAGRRFVVGAARPGNRGGDRFHSALPMLKAVRAVLAMI
jgi:hypothetical protein